MDATARAVALLRGRVPEAVWLAAEEASHHGRGVVWRDVNVDGVEWCCEGSDGDVRIMIRVDRVACEGGGGLERHAAPPAQAARQPRRWVYPGLGRGWEPPEADEDVYVHILSGDMWWRPDGHGYTADRSQAWACTLRAAWERTRHCGPEKDIVYIEALNPPPEPCPGCDELRDVLLAIGNAAVVRERVPAFADMARRAAERGCVPGAPPPSAAAEPPTPAAARDDAQWMAAAIQVLAAVEEQSEGELREDARRHVGWLRELRERRRADAAQAGAPAGAEVPR